MAPHSLQILYIFALHALPAQKMVILSAHDTKIIQSLQASRGYIFCILQHFATKLCSLTHFEMFFRFRFLAQNLVHSWNHLLTKTFESWTTMLSTFRVRENRSTRRKPTIFGRPLANSFQLKNRIFVSCFKDLSRRFVIVTEIFICKRKYVSMSVSAVRSRHLESVSIRGNLLRKKNQNQKIREME